MAPESVWAFLRKVLSPCRWIRTPDRRTHSIVDTPATPPRLQEEIKSRLNSGEAEYHVVKNLQSSHLFSKFTY